MLLEGIAIRYRVAPDGRRQVLNVVLPGDLIGFPACFFQSALFSITALTQYIADRVFPPRPIAPVSNI